MSPGFSSPPDQQLFYAQVWELVQKIPPGRVCTYGQIAAWIPVPPGMDPGDYKAWSPRWVGGAMANCPPGVPWQRVLNAQGKSSFKAEHARMEQMELLAAEGVEISSSGRVDLRLYGWGGPGGAANPAQPTFAGLDQV